MSGEPVVMQNGKLHIPNNPIIHYIEGDGIGVDISPVMIAVVDAAVKKHTVEKRASLGMKFSLERKHSMQQVNGFQKLHWMQCEQVLFQSKDP